MNCPACEKSLKEVDAGDIKIDICDSGCWGVWFDWQEIKKFEEPHEFDITGLYSGSPSSDVKKKQGVRFCPKCNEELCRRFYDMKGEVEIDQCLRCSGIWLDTNELMQIRAQYKTEAERLKQADLWLNSELKSAEEDLRQDTAEKLNISNAEVDRRANDNQIDPSVLRKIFSPFFR